MTATSRHFGVKTAAVRRLNTLRYALMVAATALSLLTLAQPSAAAPPDVPLFADRALGDGLTQAVQGLGVSATRVQVRPSASVAACAPSLGAAPRLALLGREPLRLELDRCGQAADAEVTVVKIGRQAVALVVPKNSPVWSLDSAVVYRALGQSSDVVPRNWSDLDPSYPKLPIGLLLPPTNSRTHYLFNALIMEPGCNRVADVRAPFDRDARARFCSALRNDIQVPQQHGGVEAVADWAAAAAPGAIAIVSIAELRQLDRDVVPLLINGALPTAANIESGRYPAAATISLMIVVPTAADAAQRAAARAAAFDLLAEASIGPTGSLAAAGLIPPPPPERIAARSQAVASLEQP